MHSLLHIITAMKKVQKDKKIKKDNFCLIMYLSCIFILVLIQISHPKHACARASQKYRIGIKTAFRGAKDI